MTDLSRSAFGYVTCLVPVRVLCGSADIGINPMVHGGPAALLMPQDSFELFLRIDHMVHHFRVDVVVATIEAVKRS